MKRYEGLNQDIVDQLAPNPGRKPLLPSMSHRARVALLCRMLHREGWDEHIAGHITVRQEDGTILVNPWELAWDELTASDILRIDRDGKILEGEWNTTPAIGLHLQLHAHRPDIHVVIHNHPQWSGIWANLQRIPPVYDQTSALVDGELVLYDEYEGQFNDDATTMAAVKALGDAKWALLANHGALIVARDLRQAHLRAITLEWRCKRAWYMEALGKGVALPAEEVAKIGAADPNGFPFLFEAMARRELRADPTILD
ncbi:MAG TPA: class II aldolase/adducin family protein [Myxococcota bacterium]|nr:class II aldolase/adducin family protein [Myxococcota bacterium]